MNLVTPREPFLQQLQFATSVCPSRSPRPILSDVLISVEGNKIEILATDGDLSVRLNCEDEGISGEGRVALPGATLLSAVRSMDSDVLEIKQAGQVYEIVGDKAFFKLNGDDPDLFPSIPTIEPGAGVDVSLSAFVDLCNRTTFAAAKEMGRYAFNGVLLEVDPNEITLVATDGRRLSLAKMPLETGVADRRSAVVPIKGLAQLQRLMTDEDQTLRIELRESMVALLLPHAEVQAQLVQGDFPDFRAVVPGEEDVPGIATIGRDELATAIQRALVTAGDDGPKVELSFSGGNLTVVSSKEGIGESRSDMGIDYSGETVVIRFNPNFIGEFLKTMPENQVTFRFKDRSSAGLFKVSDESVYVLMPITS